MVLGDQLDRHALRSEIIRNTLNSGCGKAKFQAELRRRAEISVVGILWVGYRVRELLHSNGIAKRHRNGNMKRVRG